MGHIKIKFLIIAFGIAAFQQITSAQFNAIIDMSTDYDDNIYLSPTKIGDFIYSTDLNLNYTLKDSATNIYYNLDYLVYNEYNIRNFLLNKVGIRHSRDFGKNNQHWLFAGTYFMDRLNNEAYYYYDYRQLYLYTNQRFSLKKTNLRTGYNFRYRNYKNIMELTNYQHYLFLQLSRTFRTRTTLLMEADLGFKSFNKTTTYTHVATGDGKGNSPSNNYTVVEEQIPNMSHMVVLFRVAQSLHDRVGIYFQYRGQFNLLDESRINSGSYFQDEELFDDPFSYTSSGLSSKLTMILPGHLNIQAGGSITGKDYISETSYISAEDSTGMGDLREDTRWVAYLKASKTFYINNKNWISSVKPYINYSYVDNKSTSYWYNYNYHYASLGIIFNF